MLSMQGPLLKGEIPHFPYRRIGMDDVNDLVTCYLWRLTSTTFCYRGRPYPNSRELAPPRPLSLAHS